MQTRESQVSVATAAESDVGHVEEMHRVPSHRVVERGLGHELRNLVMPLLLRLDAIAATEPMSPRARSELGLIREGIARVQGFAAGLQMLGDTGAGDQRKVTYLREWWPDVRPIVLSSLPWSARLTCELKDDLPPVRIAPAVLTQAIVCLLSDVRPQLQHVPNALMDVRARVEHGVLLLSLTDNRRTRGATASALLGRRSQTSHDAPCAASQGACASRALLRGYGMEMSVSDVGDDLYRIVLHLPIDASGPDRKLARGRRVRAMLDDPRQLAVARLVIAESGWQEVHGSHLNPIDVLVCDGRRFRTQPHRDAWLQELRSSGCRLIVIGDGHGEPQREDVEWLEVRELGDLAALLR